MCRDTFYHYHRITADVWISGINVGTRFDHVIGNIGVITLNMFCYWHNIAIITMLIFLFLLLFQPKDWWYTHRSDHHTKPSATIHILKQTVAMKEGLIRFWWSTQTTLQFCITRSDYTFSKLISHLWDHCESVQCADGLLNYTVQAAQYRRAVGEKKV